MIGRHPRLRPSLLSAIGLSRSTAYYRPKRPMKDWALKQQIEEILREHPAYGHKRLALALKRNKKAVLRVMKLYGLTPHRRKVRKWKPKPRALLHYPNLLLMNTPEYPHHIWVADFTYLGWKGRTVYVATVMDVYTRRIVGVSVLTTHHAVLVVQALWNAVLHHPTPLIFHSDNGREYDAAIFRRTLRDLEIRISRSAPGCPWENGYQESFYGKFKLDLGDQERFDHIGALVAEVYATIHAYNTRRIHTALRMPPAEFAKQNAGAIMKLPLEMVS